jgi:pantoate--beta-alanine ligase
MGALHAGHLALIDRARTRGDVVVVTIFVNPLQFNRGDDFDEYPRPIDADFDRCRAAGVDAVYVPGAATMYPPEFQTHVEPGHLAESLEGAGRPGHFRGVTTVVAKLFHIAEPDLAFFGQKDAAQVAIIRRMARDLNMPVSIEVCPIVREHDGLAISSRNAYLSPQDRESALVLYRALMRVKKLFASGESDSASLVAAAKEEFAADPTVKLDYVEVVDPETLEPVAAVNSRVLVVVAAIVGQTRLIDNILLEP